ncbi:hypothetical protein RFI_01845 [Reticulomyxa filosa]|uniref:Uncharacterized protein n=1 Tax=Reticulomyxa filosa TaxID=46433 RepID=X6PAY3_RETFI|nr:hypothetical protein RFI_01845 [Reticulomyxa filosa]|eukprot:ETO35229.1 hypothetical protein RFI_01845 [Reticulomyxa filosa]
MSEYERKETLLNRLLNARGLKKSNEWTLLKNIIISTPEKFMKKIIHSNLLLPSKETNQPSLQLILLYVQYQHDQWTLHTEHKEHQHEQKQGHSKTTLNIDSNGSTCNNKLNFFFAPIYRVRIVSSITRFTDFELSQRFFFFDDITKSILEIFHHSLHLCSLVHVQKLNATCKGRFTLNFEKTLLFCMSSIRTTYPLTRH